MLHGETHLALMATIRRLVEDEIEPHVDAWEEAGIFPGHALFAKPGRAGLLGITRPAQYGGQALDFSYAVAAAEAFGHISAGGVSMAIAVQTDMATESHVAGRDVLELASMARLKAARVAREIADWCVQFQGGMGYTWENRASRARRDDRLGSIGGGADEIMLQIIAKSMGLGR